MTREQCKVMLPVIEAFANGEHIEFRDCYGNWQSANNIGFGANLDQYRMIKDGVTTYFHESGVIRKVPKNP